jgi:anti-anti-sigma factor
MSKYTFEIIDESSCLIAVFRGEISTHDHSDFRNDYNEICRQLHHRGEQKLILDLAETTYFGSLFIGMIVKMSVSIRSQQGQLVLCGLSVQLKDLMKQLLLLEREADSVSRLRHVDTRADALAVIVASNS